MAFGQSVLWRIITGNPTERKNSDTSVPAKKSLDAPDLPHISENLKAIQNNFLKKYNNDSTRAAAITIVYLCLAFNPYREKMADPKVLKELGLIVSENNDETATANLEHLKKLADELKQNPEIVRREILFHMAGILRDQENVKNVLQSQEFGLTEADLKKLTKVCMQGAAEVYDYENDLANQRENPTFNGTLFTVTLFGGVGGYFGGKALAAGLTGAGVALSATGAGAIVAGAIFLAAASVALLTYGIYSLINNYKTKSQYEASANNENNRFVGTMETFMDDSHKMGDLPNLIASLSK